MNGILFPGSDDLDKRFASLTWSSHGTETRHESTVTRLSCIVDELPGLLVVERCRIQISAMASLVRLRVMHARLSGVAAVTQLTELETSMGEFSRQVWELGLERHRIVIAAAAEINGGLDAIVQFVVPGGRREMEEVEALSRLSIAKVIKMHELDAPR